MGLEDGESLPHQVGKALGVALGMAVKLDMDESGEREAEGSGIELGAISFDEPGALQGLAAARRLGFRKANFLCEVGTAQRAVALKSVEQTQIAGKCNNLGLTSDLQHGARPRCPGYFLCLRGLRGIYA